MREKEHLKGQGLDERIILKWVFKAWAAGTLTVLI